MGLSTAAVYAGVSLPERPQSGEAMFRAVSAGDVEEIGRRLHNRLQAPAERLCPAVAALQARLASLHPAGAMMSGSGSSLFAMCRDRNEALRIAHALDDGPEEGQRPRVYLVRSCS
jgi:4-diphosphocytidyl-2-C-methyl-D-erythritol kinase